MPSNASDTTIIISSTDAPPPSTITPRFQYCTRATYNSATEVVRVFIGHLGSWHHWRRQCTSSSIQNGLMVVSSPSGWQRLQFVGFTGIGSLGKRKNPAIIRQHEKIASTVLVELCPFPRIYRSRLFRKVFLSTQPLLNSNSLPLPW